MNKCYSFLFILCILCLSALQLHAGIVPSQAHRARENEYNLNFYFLDLDIEDTTNFISGNVMIRGYALTPLDTFAVELDTTFTIDSIVANLNGLNAQRANHLQNNTEFNVLLPFTVPTGAYTEVRIYYHGKVRLQDGYDSSGFYNGSNQIFTVSEPYYSYTWFPCKQELTDKADSSWFFITAGNYQNTALSNGVLTGQVSVGPDKTQYQWKSHHPIDYYLISFVVGDFFSVTDYYQAPGQPNAMPVDIYFQYATDTGSVYQAINILKVFGNLYGQYPFYDEKLGLAFANYGGGMENQTLITLAPQSFDQIGLHEMAHQWFGDNVTCASFKDVMINEGFATWSESNYNEFSGGGDQARQAFFNDFESYDSAAWAHGSGYDYGDTTTVTGDAFYFLLIYAKNAMMLNSLRFTVNNDSLLFLGLRNYQNQYRGSTAYGSTLRDAMENTTGIDLTNFFNQWYYGYGYPIFNYRYNQVNDTLILQVTETTSSDSTPFFETPLQIGLATSTGDTIVRVSILHDTSLFYIPISGTFDTAAFDPNQWIANGHGHPGVYDTTLKIPPPAADTTIDTTTTSIKSPAANTQLTLYPNPATDQLYIKTENIQPVTTTIYDADGRLIFAKPFAPVVDVNTLSSGVYFVAVKSENGFVRKRFIKM